MQNALPEMLDFLKQVERKARYDGVLPVNRLDRLGSSLCSDQGEIHASVSFSTRAGTPCLDGNISAELELECQRCLKPMTLRFESSFHLGLIDSEQDIDLLPQEFEPLLLAEGEQSLIDIIEDETILSLPIVARHDEHCSELVGEQDESEQDSEEETYKPFAGLKDLMTN